MSELLTMTPRGLYCEAGNFFVDPHKPVDRAVITHAHADHACWGCEKYLAAAPSEHLLRMRLAEEAEFEFLDYGQSISVGGVEICFAPAGHILGSAQVRLQYRGRIEVVTGDYKLGQDPTCASWEPVKCHRLVSESTFGLPVYRWPSTEEVFGEINRWWRANAAEGRCSVLYGYAVGKSQRLLAGIDETIGPIFTHGAVEKGCQAYRKSGIGLPATEHVAVAEERKQTWQGAMILAVPSTHGTSWLRRFGKIRTAMASGWMMIRGTRRRRNVDRGFVLSDHVDWSSLIEAVRLCEPESVWVTHGYTATVARYLRELGYDAQAIGLAGRAEEE